MKLKSGGQWLQAALLRSGAVRARTWADNRAMAGELYEAEAYARNRGLGLWKLEPYRVLTPAEAERADGFQIVEGRVRRIGQDGALQFGEDGAGFVGQIDVKAAPEFKTAGKAADQLRGRLVRVRGWMVYGYDGPQIRLDHPEQVEVLKEKD